MEERENYDWLRVVASGAAVLLHICAKVINNYQFSDRGSVLMGLLVSSMTRFVVPLFIMISGAIFLGKSYRWEGGKVFLRKRMGRILPALIFWNIFYFLVFNRGSLVSGLETFWKYSQTYYHLYYLMVALGLYAVTPILRIIKNKKFALVVSLTFCFIYILGYYLAWWRKADWPIVIFVPYIGYYLLGNLLEKIKIRKIYLLVVVALGLLMFAVNSHALYLHGATDGGQIAFDRLWPWVGLQAVAVFLAIKNLKKNKLGRLVKVLGEVSFGVYLIHPLITDLVLKQKNSFMGVGMTFWWIVSQWLMAWGLSVLLVLMLKRLSLIKVVVGG
ncbi:MAG: acyltransferase family protein [Candidatus Shapirobacteria bacterium]|jgi:surface polysaccharide O-acyltransferase-like enzyme